MKQNFKNQPQNRSERLTFLQKYELLPEAVKKRFIKQICVALLLAVVLTLIIIIMKEPQLCVGYLFVAYIAYLGLDIVWSFHNGKIICQRMLCVKATRFLKKEQVKVLCREIETDKAPEDAMHTFYVSAGKQDIAQMTPGTVLTAYYKQGTTEELIAWTIIGSAE
jgi:hypothetical protein